MEEDPVKEAPIEEDPVKEGPVEEDPLDNPVKDHPIDEGPPTCLHTVSIQHDKPPNPPPHPSSGIKTRGPQEREGMRIVSTCSSPPPPPPPRSLHPR